MQIISWVLCAISVIVKFLSNCMCKVLCFFFINELHFFGLNLRHTSGLTDLYNWWTSMHFMLTDSSAPQPVPVDGMVTLTARPANGLSVRRFSHSSVLVTDRYVLTAGGFGEVDGRHQRVQEVSITDTVTMATALIRCHSDDLQCQCGFFLFL